MEDLVSDDDQLVNTRAEHRNQPCDSRKIQLLLDERSDTEEDYYLGHVDSDHGEYDCGLAVPEEDHNTNSDRCNDENDDGHRLEIV